MVDLKMNINLRIKKHDIENDLINPDVSIQVNQAEGA